MELMEAPRAQDEAALVATGHDRGCPLHELALSLGLEALDANDERVGLIDTGPPGLDAVSGPVSSISACSARVLGTLRSPGSTSRSARKRTSTRS
jgi:hypothetical protein